MTSAVISVERETRAHSSFPRQHSSYHGHSSPRRSQPPSHNGREPLGILDAVPSLSHPLRSISNQASPAPTASTSTQFPPSPHFVSHISEDMQPDTEAPSTPSRGRLASRYPAALSKGEPGRVPLHRRGTSRTLEAMEDLLRENGYKETRILTPEAERIQAMTEERRRQSTWRIRQLLAGWLPGADESEPATDDESTPGPRR